MELLSVHLVNPSDNSFGTAVITPRWLFVLAAATPQIAGDPILVDESLEQELEALTPVSNAPSPFEQAARTEDAQRLAHSLQMLEPIYREALVLRFQEDLSLQEMAAVIGASVSTVSSRVYRGLAALRAQLDGGAHAN